jgi:phosphomannomutase/phosphoglucomutase
MAKIAMGIGRWFKERNSQTLVIGYDVRLSSPQIHSILMEGLLHTGINVIDVGLVPTPLLNFSTKYYNASGGVMITASHNPPEFNGLKICSERTLYGDDLQEIYKFACGDLFTSSDGEYVKRNPLDAYLKALSNRVALSNKVHVVVDGANGANGQVVPYLLRRLGCQVSEIFCELNGNFSNRDPDPTALHATEPLVSKVIEKKADIGLAFDGDGDRVIVVNELGQTILGDQILMLLAGDAIKRGQTKKIVYEVLCSKAIPDYIEANGGQAILAPSGYAYVHNAMLSSCAQIGGEMSGHFFLLDNVFKFDDAILASMVLISLLSAKRKPLSTLIGNLPHYFRSREYRQPCPDNEKGEIVSSIQEYYQDSGHKVENIDGASISFGDTWALIRQSNTQPVLSVMFESRVSDMNMKAVRKEVFNQLAIEYKRHNLIWSEPEE